MRTSQQMIDKYNAKYSPTQMDAVREAVKVMAKTNFTTYANDWEVKADEVRAVLNALGVADIMYFGYFGFAGRMYHIWKHFAGESAAIAAAVYLADFVAMGLTQSVLETIRTTVFNISAPVGP